MTRVEVSAPVQEFVRLLAPEPQRTLRLAIRGLAQEHGDIRALEGPLNAYHRLRIGGFRVVFAYASAGKKARVIRCIFAERRSLVYEVFAQMLRERLLRPE